ncbi:hypothetical protein BN59_03081 [Legionella massiliensis]|uniref:Uncharacterized protein n=1 Tax=Legionella massiliensis TaxID=1034943 RepID=A0A078L0I4_9GAMM|nr:hypothetical protein [Legionella massiliensis]CDZ78767.1 hypothetical protein BN59_03081 [Legionella massiliensis]CEE14505.1 hypothetical protein BN1094_03081 [Legionella massiliensis]
MTNTNAENTEVLTAEDYNKAMNFIAQNLLSSLSQSMGALPQQLHNRKVVSQALAAFLTNIIYKQFPGDKDLSQEMLNEITEFVKLQLASIPEPA